MKKLHKNIRVTTLVLAGLTLPCFKSSATTLEYDGPEISFEQVYENPDDNELKLNYAKQQAAAGDLLSAAGALEGMLFSQPNWDSARLFYAIVLYELDDKESAMREFDILDKRPLTAADQKTVDRYRSGPSQPKSNDVEISGVLELGVRTDNNAGNALFDSIIEFADESDTSAFANAAVQVSVPISKKAGLKLNLGARGQTRRHSTFSTSDYDVLGASLGVAGKTSNLFWEADIDFDNVYLSGDKYLTQMGPKLSIGAMVSENTRLTLTGAHYYQDFEAISFNNDERFRSGHRSMLSTNLYTRVDDSLNYGLSAGYEDKNATQNALAYGGFNLGGTIFKGFENGLYVKGKARYRNLNFDGLDQFGTIPTDRSDNQISGRLGLGASVNKIGQLFGLESKPELSRLYLETGLNYTDYNSNISIYDYENFGGELKLALDF